jgi:Tfp pilus assembly protein FimT
LLLVIAIGMTLCAFGLVRTQAGMAAFRANGAMSSLKSKLQFVRELAISRQRDIKLTYNGTNGINFFQINPDATETQVDTLVLEGFTVFTTFGGQNAPDPANAQWCTDALNTFRNLNTQNTLRFNSDGALIDSTDRKLVSGCFYLGKTGDPTTARSISMFGATGRARTYRWSNTTWIH